MVKVSIVFFQVLGRKFLTLMKDIYIYIDRQIDRYTHTSFIKIARRNINNLRYADDTTLMAESKEKLKSLLMKVKEKSEKAVFKKYSKN